MQVKVKEKAKHTDRKCTYRHSYRASTWCSLGQYCDCVRELHHWGGVAGQPPPLFYLLIEYSSRLNEWRMDRFMKNTSLKNLKECAYIYVHVCFVCVSAQGIWLSPPPPWTYSRSPSRCAHTVAFTFPDESCCACLVMLTVPSTIKPRWTATTTHSCFPFTLTSLTLCWTLCCQLNLEVNRKSESLIGHITDIRVKLQGDIEFFYYPPPPWNIDVAFVLQDTETFAWLLSSSLSCDKSQFTFSAGIHQYKMPSLPEAKDNYRNCQWGYHKIRTEMKEMKVCLRNQIQPGIYINGAKDIWAKNFGCVQEMIQRRFRFVFLRVRRKTRGQVGRAIKPEMHLVAIQTQQDINRNEKVLLSKEVSRPTFHLPLWKSPADWEGKENNTPKTLTIITKEIKEAILEEVL